MRMDWFLAARRSGKWIFMVCLLFNVNTAVACPSMCSCGTTNGNVAVNCEDKKLQILPANISRNTQLLRFRGNRITRLPSNFPTILPETRTLSLENNLVEYLQDGIFSNLKQLGEVFLSNNRINKIGARIFANSAPGKSIFFKLENNLVETISEGIFKNSTSLFLLFWNSNRIKTILPGVFAEAGGVRYLNLESNRIEKLPLGIFKDLTKAYYLGLANNKLTALKADTFQGLQRVERLTLQRNKLSSLPADVFKHLPVVKSINLASNLFSEPPIEAIRALPSFATVRLKDNPIKCTCALRKSLSDMTIRNKISDLAVIKCANLNTAVIKDLESSAPCVTEAAPTTPFYTTKRKNGLTKSMESPKNIKELTTKYPTSLNDNTLMTKKVPKGDGYENKRPIPLIIGVAIGGFIIIVVIILFVYLYRRPIAARASTLSLPRKKKAAKDYAFVNRSPFNDYSTDYNI